MCNDNVPDITIFFHDLPWPTFKFHDFPGLEKEILEFHDFPGFQWLIQTLKLIRSPLHHCTFVAALAPYILFNYSQHWYSNICHVLTNLWVWTPMSSLLVHRPWVHLASFPQGLESDILHSNNAVLQENMLFIISASWEKYNWLITHEPWVIYISNLPLVSMHVNKLTC